MTNASDLNGSDSIGEVSARLQNVADTLGGAVLGQRASIERLLLSMLAGGHVLLDGVPGIAKTLLARSVAKLIGAHYRRIQFTPDLMPADLVGTRVFNPKTREFELHEGPVFTELLLADEINRTPPKTQAALLEAMEERQVTIDGHARKLPDFFFVVATENPLEFDGTYALPEAQTDRFCVKIEMGYPDEDAERQLLSQVGTTDRIRELDVCLSPDDIVKMQSLRAGVKAQDAMCDYVLRLLRATRERNDLRLGASPRAGLMLMRVAQAHALMAGRDYAMPDDAKAVAEAVLCHRLLLSVEAELDGKTTKDVIDDILDEVTVL